MSPSTRPVALPSPWRPQALRPPERCPNRDLNGRSAVSNRCTCSAGGGSYVEGMVSPAGNPPIPRRGALRPLDLPPVDVKVVLRNRAGETELVWCTVVDPAKNLYRIANIPFLRERPTFGDVIVATRGRDGLLALRRTHTGGGFRWGALEYAEGTRLAPMVDWLEHTRGVKTEGLVAPEGEASGIVGLAIPRHVDPKELFARTEYAFPGVWRLGCRPTRDGSPQSYARAVTDALFPALYARDLPRLRALIAEGADVNAVDKNGHTPAFLAVSLEDVKFVAVLRDAGANLLAWSSYGQSALICAAAEGPVEVVKMILAAGADPNEQERLFGMTPLHLAALRNHAAVLTLLLRAGGCTSLRDDDGRTALMCAAGSGSVDAARVLLPSCSVSDRSEALRVATKNASLRMAKLLLAAGADPLEKDPDGTSALSLAWASKKAPGIVKLLANAASNATSPRVAS